MSRDEQSFVDNAPAGLRGLAVGTVVLLGLAYAIAATASFAHAALSGCWLSCGGDPDPAWGLVWVAVSTVLLFIPAAVGLHIARIRARSAWVTAALVVVVLAAAWIWFSLDPDNAELFISLGADGRDLPERIVEG